MTSITVIYNALPSYKFQSFKKNLTGLGEISFGIFLKVKAKCVTLTGIQLAFMAKKFLGVVKQT